MEAHARQVAVHCKFIACHAANDLVKDQERRQECNLLVSKVVDRDAGIAGDVLVRGERLLDIETSLR